MKIQSVVLKDFKRFTDLTIQNIPSTARLVVLVGPNGSGKTSLFEAFNVLLQRMRGGGSFDWEYHLKVAPLSTWSQSSGSYFLFENNKINLTFHDRVAFDWSRPTEGDKESFYIRSSHRHEADFTATTFQRQASILDDPARPQTMMATESRVSSNYQYLIANTLSGIYDGEHDASTVIELRDQMVGEIADSLNRVLPALKLRGPGHPMRDGTFFFEKGRSLDWKYKNLSGGEKAAFDLILDFAVKAPHFRNTVYCIDEPEVHMHTSVQAALLTELLNKLPGESQLWVATHSAAMMRAARDLHRLHPGEVVFLDFGGRDFDAPVVMEPSIPDRAFWKRNFEVALGDFAQLVAPSRIVFCEGEGGASGVGFDAQCYETIFAQEFPDVEFVSCKGASELQKNALSVSAVMERVLSGVQFTMIRDLDDCTPQEVQEWNEKGVRVLSRRTIESFLWDAEILARLCQKFGQPEKTAQIQQIALDSLTTSVEQRGNPLDDVKSPAGTVYTQIKRILALTQVGDNVSNFSRLTLAPLITPDTQTYQDLKRDIFG